MRCRWFVSVSYVHHTCVQLTDEKKDGKGEATQEQAPASPEAEALEAWCYEYLPDSHGWYPLGRCASENLTHKTAEWIVLDDDTKIVQLYDSSLVLMQRTRDVMLSMECDTEIECKVGDNNFVAVLNSEAAVGTLGYTRLSVPR